MGSKLQPISLPTSQTLNLDPLSLESPSQTHHESEPTKYYNMREIHREVLASTSVTLANMHPTGERVAIKKIYKEYLVNDFLKEQAKQECQLHCDLDHPNIAKALEWFEDDEEYSIVLEYVDKPTYLKDKIKTNLTPIKNEQKMKSYVKDILEALVYLHSKDIVHGDIKLENILVKSKENSDASFCTVKLCDFGLSRILDKETRKAFMKFAVGSTCYMAPEIKANAYVDDKIDVWALGIVMYKMAVAYKPTQMPGYKTYNAPVPFRKQDWRDRSQELQDLVAQMLVIDPSNRITAAEALQHPWFCK